MVKEVKLMESKIKKTIGEKIFDSFNIVFMLLLGFSTLYPFLYLISLTLSSPEVSFAQIHIIPPKMTMENIVKVVTNPNIASGFGNTIIRTVLGTTISLIFTIFAAYPLSKKYFPHRGFWTAFIVVTMFVSGGLIPNYLLIKRLGLFDSVWALILPNLVNTFNMIIARNFFMALPESVEESARIDGANDIIILFKIVIPMSMPIIATLALWISVWHWNAWFDSLLYMTKSSKHVLQIVMRRIVLEGTQQMMDLNSIDEQHFVNPESLKAATVVITTLPILLVYPFVQKYFVKGVMVGSLKG